MALELRQHQIFWQTSMATHTDNVCVIPTAYLHQAEVGSKLWALFFTVFVCPFQQNELKHTREIAALRKEQRQKENKIRSLQAESRVKDAVLRRRNEEVSALRSRGPPGLSAKAAGRPKRPQATGSGFSPKAAKIHWSKLENQMNKVKVNKKAVVMVEREMERCVLFED